MSTPTISRNTLHQLITRIPGGVALAERDGLILVATCIPILHGFNSVWRGAQFNAFDTDTGLRIFARYQDGYPSPKSTIGTHPWEFQDDDLMIIEDTPTDTDLLLRTEEDSVDNGDPDWQPILTVLHRLAETARPFHQARLNNVPQEVHTQWVTFSKHEQGTTWAINPTGVECDGRYTARVCSGDDVDAERHGMSHIMLTVAVSV